MSVPHAAPATLSTDALPPEWQAHWICPPQPADGQLFFAARLKLSLTEPLATRIFVSADQRYELYVNGERVGRGPERGDMHHWHYQAYDLDLPAGEHVLVARVWWLDPDGPGAPAAQVTFKPGFMLDAEGDASDLLATGKAAWETKPLGGLQVTASGLWGASQFAGGMLELDGSSFDWGFERGEGDGWTTPNVGSVAASQSDRWGQLNGPCLSPSKLAPMLAAVRTVGSVRHVDSLTDDGGGSDDSAPIAASACDSGERDAWRGMLTSGEAVTVPANASRRVLIDLQNYYCAYPLLSTTGGEGATVRLCWAEALYVPGGNDKQNRNEIEGKVMRGRTDTFRLGGGENRLYTTLWWECGRYVMVTVRTGDEPLTVKSLQFEETRYPLDMDAAIETSDAELNAAAPIMWRGLQMCSHETYMDCPYYEQLMYAGDTRLEALVTLLGSRDDRLPRKAIDAFAWSQAANGLTLARYPSRREQVIPQFSLIWVTMLHDWAMWRGEADFIRSHLPRARTVIDVFLSKLDDAGLPIMPDGWSWMDWVPEWQGAAPDDEQRRSGLNSWLLLYVLERAAELERWAGCDFIAQRYDQAMAHIHEATVRTYWDPDRGMFATDAAHAAFAEHTQCLALLTRQVTDAQRESMLAGLLEASDLHRTTIYFSHYLLEALSQHGQMQAVIGRLDLWRQLKGLGFCTTFEEPEPSRSDCHAWGAHPLYHAWSNILGVKPGGFGFERVSVRPQLGPLTSAAGSVVHPAGMIHVEVEQAGQSLCGKVTLPNGLAGELVLPSGSAPLKPGENRF